MGQGYILTALGEAWTAVGLLAWLKLNQPARLEQPMYLRLPDTHQDGAIYQPTRSGGFLRRYRIEQRKPL